MSIDHDLGEVTCLDQSQDLRAVPLWAQRSALGRLAAAYHSHGLTNAGARLDAECRRLETTLAKLDPVEFPARWSEVMSQDLEAFHDPDDGEPVERCPLCREWPAAGLTG